MISDRLRYYLRRHQRPLQTYNRIEVSRSALKSNLRYFRANSNQAVIPVLKSNAYGHGVELVAEALEGEAVPYLAVDGYFEALRIRRVVSTPVLIMGMIRPENYARLQYRNFTFVVHDEATIMALGNTNKQLKIHLEINTGMNRHGIKLHETGRYLELIASFPKLELEGVMSHLADSDGEHHATVKQATDLYDKAVEQILATGVKPSLFHLAQTAGSLKAPSKYANTFRLGIGLYGSNPFTGEQAALVRGLKPALQLFSTVSIIHNLEPGDKVSYNYTFTAKRPMRLGVLPLGYYEGLNRQLSNTGVVGYNTTYLPIVGRVCMNHTMVDLTNTDIQVGDEVVIYSNVPGSPNTIDKIAADHKLFNYQLLSGLSPDVRRILVA